MFLVEEYGHLKIQLQDILSATDNFSPDKLIGHGGFGNVYKGEFSFSGRQSMVAFKRLDGKFGQGNTEFWKEILMLSKYKHENLVSLLHFCFEGDERILVYEYASRGSLDHYLSDANLTWIQRLKICVGVACGLNYLHDPMETKQRVLHRDIKSSNILLDEEWNAKVSDFGLSKVGPANQPQTYVVSNVVGTFGYCDPLYFETGLLSKESDVYSFGVVLFEVMCGRLCCEYRNGEMIRILVPIWKQCFEENRLDDIIFHDIKEQIQHDSLMTFSTIANQCLQRDHKRRPTMAKIVQELEVAIEQLGINIIEESDEIKHIGVKLQPTTTTRNSNNTPNTNTVEDPVSYSPYLAPVLEVPTSSFSEAADDDPLPVVEATSSFSEAADDDPLPVVEALQISGEAFPGRELQASGYSLNGTTSCNFEWVRHMEDGSVSYIEGAKQPNYLVTADDVDTYLAIEVQPMDNRKHKGELVKAFANDNRKIVCDPYMQDHIRRAIQAGYAEHRVSLWAYLGIWEPVTLVIKKDGINIKGSGPSVTDKFDCTTGVLVPRGNPMEFSFFSSSVAVERRFQVEHDSAGGSSRDVIVLTMRFFIKRFVEKK